MDTQTLSNIISQLVAPVVMISAAGLLCLALFSRLAVLVARSRSFASERVTLMRSLDKPELGPKDAALDRLRLEALEAHASRVLRRAALLRAALQCLLAGVLAMVVSSAAIGLSLLNDNFWLAALITFGLGLCSIAAGIVLVMAELAQALRDVKLEHDLLRQFDTMTDGSQPPDP